LSPFSEIKKYVSIFEQNEVDGKIQCLTSMLSGWVGPGEAAGRICV